MTFWPERNAGRMLMNTRTAAFLETEGLSGCPEAGGQRMLILAQTSAVGGYIQCGWMQPPWLAPWTTSAQP